VPGFSPKITLNPAVGPPGTITTVKGTGFPPNAAVNLSWTPGSGLTHVIADASGNFTTEMIIIVPDILGPRHAQAAGYPTATAAFLVVPDSAQPGGSNAALLFRSEGP
jgi:hypothetical protein